MALVDRFFLSANFDVCFDGYEGSGPSAGDAGRRAMAGMKQGVVSELNAIWYQR